MPKVSIITINYNGLEDTIECLESLKKIIYPNYEVFVVDNASKNREGNELKKRFGKYINLIQSDKNLGFSGGNNLAIREVIKEGKSKYICLLNNDTIVDKFFLKYLVTKIKVDKRICGVTPEILKYYDKTIIDGIGISYYKCGLSFGINNNKIKHSKVNDKIFAAGAACVLHSVDALKSICIGTEYFDEDFFLYGEDLDLGFRMLLKGYYPSYEKKSIVFHKGSKSVNKKGASFKYYYLSRNLLFVILKNYPISLLIKYLIPIIIAQIITVLFYMTRGEFKLIWNIYKGFFSKFFIMYKKRKIILQNSNVQSIYIESFFEKHIFPYKYLNYFKNKYL